MDKIMSIDVESDGLWGKPFAIGVICYEYEESLYVFREVITGYNKTKQERVALFTGQALGEWEIVKKAWGWAETERVSFRLPDSVVTNGWVIENVLPTLSDMKITNDSYESMLAEFSQFYEEHEKYTCLYHMGHVVESFLFRECVRLGFIGEFNAPYTPIEVSEYIRNYEKTTAGPDGVDKFISQIEYEPKTTGGTHNPLYDCECAFAVWEHITRKQRS